MSIYFSSMFTDDIGNLEIFLDKHGSSINTVKVILDSNICVQYEKYIRYPAKYRAQNFEWYSILQNLQRILFNCKDKIYANLAIDESTNAIADNSTIVDKKENLIESLKKIIFMHPVEFEKQSLIVKNLEKPTFSKQEKPTSKISVLSSITKETPYIYYLRLIYPSLIKLYLLNKLMDDKFVIFEEFLNFIDERIDLALSPLVVFSIYYIFDNQNKIAKILKHKSKTFADMIHNFWNASMDLYFISNAANHIEENITPIFITADKSLHLLSQKLIYKKFTIRKDGGIGQSQNEVGVNDDFAFMKNKDKEKMIEINNAFSQKRISKKHIKVKNNPYILDVCKEMEEELFKYYNE